MRCCVISCPMAGRRSDRNRRVATPDRGASGGSRRSAARKQLARDLVAEIRDTDQRLKTLTAQITDSLDAHGTRLREVPGIGPVIAGRLLGRTRRAGRFRSASAFANYAGV